MADAQTDSFHPESSSSITASLDIIETFTRELYQQQLKAQQQQGAGGEIEKRKPASDREASVSTDHNAEWHDAKPSSTSAPAAQVERLQSQFEELLVQSHVLRTENETLMEETRSLREALAQESAEVQLLRLQMASVRQVPSLTTPSSDPPAPSQIAADVVPPPPTETADAASAAVAKEETADAASAAVAKEDRHTAPVVKSPVERLASLLQESLGNADAQRFLLWVEAHTTPNAHHTSDTAATFSLTMKSEKDGGPLLQLAPAPKRRPSTPTQQRATGTRPSAPTAVGMTPPARTALSGTRSPALGSHVLLPSSSPALGGGRSLALHAWGTSNRSITPPSTTATRPVVSKSAAIAARPTLRTSSPAASASPQTVKQATPAVRTASKSPSASRPGTSAVIAKAPPASEGTGSPATGTQYRRGSSPAASCQRKVVTAQSGVSKLSASSHGRLMAASKPSTSASEGSKASSSMAAAKKPLPSS